MVSAAELEALHLHQQQQQQNAAQQQPLVDPFPTLREQDPFPAFGAPPVNGAVNGRKAKPQAASPSPDFDSQASFPALGASTPQAKGQWGKKPGSGQGAPPTWSGSAPVIQRTLHQDTFSVPSSEETSAKLGGIINRVQTKYKDVRVEASTTRKTNTTTFVIKGPNEVNVRSAKKELLVGLARNVSLVFLIPASLRAYVIGVKGKNLKNITDQTGVRINIPKAEQEQHVAAPAPKGDVDYENDEQIEVTIDGDEVNARTAKSMLAAIVAERKSRTTQRLTEIEHDLYPFIAGPRNSNIPLLEQGDVTIRLPPRGAFLPSRDPEVEAAEKKKERDLSIIVTGDRQDVAKTVQTIERQVEEMRHSFRTLQLNIPKRQHRFLVGDAAQDILASTGCSVELTPIDDPSESVTIRGPEAKLPLALTEAIKKANAVRVETIDVGAAHRDLEHAKVLLRWLSISGKIPRDQNVQVHLPRPAALESSGVAHIEIVGEDPSSVAAVRSQLDGLVKTITPALVTVMDIDPVLHRFIIGKKGASLTQYSKKGVDVLFPPVSDAAGEDARSDVVLVLGDTTIVQNLGNDKKSRDAAAVAILAQVKSDIEKASQQAADIKTEILQVPSKLHRTIVGPGGTTLNAILGEERIAIVQVGSSSKAPSNGEDTITVRGPSGEVARVAEAIRKIAKEAEEDAIVNGHSAEFTLNSQHIPHIVGRGGSGVTKLREDLGVRIDFGDNPEAGAKKPSKIKVQIVGRKENVEEAKKRILSQAEKLADETSVTLKIPANLHGAIIGQGGKYVTRLQDSYGVRINFPSQSDNEKSTGQKSDEVIVKGGKKGVEGAKAELLELVEYEKENNNVVVVPVSSKSIARIMGKGGANINRLRDETEAQIDVDHEDSQDNTASVRLRGTKKAIAAAKTAILATAADVDSEASYTITIPSRFHGQIIGPGGQNLRDLIVRAGGPSDSRAAAQLVQFPRRGAEQADLVTVRGPADAAKSVKDELESLAKELGSRIVLGVVVPQGAHRSLMGRIRELQASYPSSKIVVPGWREYDQLEVSNNDELSGASPTSIVKIQGSADACQALKQEISEAFVANSETLQVPHAIASRLANPALFRRLREEYGVSVDAPKSAVPTEDVSSIKRPATSAARIDDDEDDAELPYEEVNVDLSSSDDVVTWSFNSRSQTSLQDAIKDLTKDIERMRAFTTQGRLWVESRAIPRIVGRGGSGLRDIESITEASIDIPRDAGGLVIILGTNDSVQDARQRITRIALQGRHRD